LGGQGVTPLDRQGMSPCPTPLCGGLQ
jgi:hypothetical protein